MKGWMDMKNVFASLGVFVVLLVAAAQCVGAPSVQNVGKDAKIDWTNLVYIATGEGAMPSAKECPNRARARLMAKDYAKMAALANLLMAIEGTTISYESTGKDYMADTTIRQKIEGFVKNATVTKVSDQKSEGDTIVIVEVRAPMFSNNGPGSVFLSQQESRVPASALKVVTKPDKAFIPGRMPAFGESKPLKPYTGLIINCIGYNIDRCMSPKIRTNDGGEVWGTVQADPDMLIERGIVSYATSMKEAKKNPRAGANPLVIRATGRAGGRFYSDPVISDKDATLLFAENAKSGFLSKFNVVFVKDPVLSGR